MLWRMGWRGLGALLGRESEITPCQVSVARRGDATEAAMHAAWVNRLEDVIEAVIVFQ